MDERTRAPAGLGASCVILNIVQNMQHEPGNMQHAARSGDALVGLVVRHIRSRGGAKPFFAVWCGSATDQLWARV